MDQNHAGASLRGGAFSLPMRAEKRFLYFIIPFFMASGT